MRAMRVQEYLGGREALVDAVHTPRKPPFWGDKPPRMFQEDKAKKVSRVSEVGTIVTPYRTH